METATDSALTEAAGDDSTVDAEDRRDETVMAGLGGALRGVPVTGESVRGLGRGDRITGEGIRETTGESIVGLGGALGTRGVSTGDRPPIEEILTGDPR